MLYDKEGQFSDNQAITATAVSENVVCLAQGPMKEVAYGTPIPIRIQVTEDFAGATSVEFQLETSATEDFASSKVMDKTDAIPVADLKAGYVAAIDNIPKGNLGYARLQYKVVGTATAGKITAGIIAGKSGSYHNM